MFFKAWYFWDSEESSWIGAYQLSKHIDIMDRWSPTRNGYSLIDSEFKHSCQ